MKNIKYSEIVKTVAELYVKANCVIRPDVKKALIKAGRSEKGLAKYAIDSIVQNIDIAEKEHMPMCQDTGMAVVFLEIGQDIHIGGDLEKAVNDGIGSGCKKGFLRASVVNDPRGKRKNTGDNTPAVIHVKIIPGNKLKITVMPKGFGSENTSSLKMFLPGDSTAGIEDFVLDAVKKYGPNACPPLVIGIGIGGTADKAMLLAKEALLKKIESKSHRVKESELEKRLLKKINKLGIGPGGFGGKTTALSVNIMEFPTHIAGLPVAINISCWALRGATAII